MARSGGEAGQGMNQPLEPTATAYRMHKGFSFSLQRDRVSDQREPPTQMSAAMLAAPFDCHHPLCNTVSAAAIKGSRLSAFFSLTSPSSGSGPNRTGTNF